MTVKNEFWKNKRLLYASTIDISKPNGPGVNEFEFINVLGREFAEKVTVIVPSVPDTFKNKLSPKCLHSRKHKRFGVFNLILNQLSLLIVLFKHIRQQQYDLIIFRISYLPWHLYLVTKLLSCPYVIKTAGVSGENLIRAQGWKSSIAKGLAIIDDVFVRAILKKSVAIDTCTTILQKGVVDKYELEPYKVKHVENSANVYNFKVGKQSLFKIEKGLDRFDILIGYVGGLPSQRGACELVEALPALRSIYPDLGVLIVGYDKGLEEVKSRANELELHDAIVFAGEVAYSDVPSYVACLSLGVAFDDPEKLKITGNSNQKVRQYLSSGLPVVASTGGNEFLSELGLGCVVDHRKIEHVVSAILFWIEKSESEKALYEQKARRYAELKLSLEYALQERLSLWQCAMERTANAELG